MRDGQETVPTLQPVHNTTCAVHLDAPEAMPAPQSMDQDGGGDSADVAVDANAPMHAAQVYVIYHGRVVCKTQFDLYS